jgi:hypothetical protein
VILYCEPKHQSSRLTLSRGFDIELFYSIFYFKARCVCVVLNFWMHLFINTKVGFFRFYECISGG